LEDCIYNPTYDEIQENDGETNGCGSWAAIVYFVSFTLIVAFIFLNLFIAVIIQGYLTSVNLEGGMLTGKSYDDFREAWSKFDPKGSGYIQTGDLVPLGALLDLPLGYKDNPD